MGAVFTKVHAELTEELARNKLVLFIALAIYAVAVAGNHVQHGGEPVIGIMAGIAAAAAVFAIAFFIEKKANAR